MFNLQENLGGFEHEVQAPALPARALGAVRGAHRLRPQAAGAGVLGCWSGPCWGRKTPSQSSQGSKALDWDFGVCRRPGLDGRVISRLQAAAGRVGTELPPGPLLSARGPWSQPCACRAERRSISLPSRSPSLPAPGAAFLRGQAAVGEAGRERPQVEPPQLAGRLRAGLGLPCPSNPSSSRPLLRASCPGHLCVTLAFCWGPEVAAGGGRAAAGGLAALQGD